MNPKPRLAIFRSNPISPNPRVEKAASAAAQLADVRVIGWDRTGKLQTPQKRPDFTLELFSLPASFGSGIKNLPRLILWEWFLVKWVLRNGGNYSVFHACDFDTIFPSLLGKLLFKVRVIYDICDFYADHVRNTPRWILRLILLFDRFAIRTSDAVILVDEARSNQLGNVRSKRLEFIYNSPKDIVNGEDLKPFQSKLNLVYVGLLQVERGLLELFEVLKKHPDWHCDLAGYGGDENMIVSAAAQVAGITWHGRVDYSRALHLSQSADVLIATYDPTVPNHRFSSPNKVFEAMMLGKPIVVAQDTHVDEIIEKWHCGLVVPYGDRDQLEYALGKLSEDEELRIMLGKNARRAYEERYSWGIMERRLLDLYSSLLT